MSLMVQRSRSCDLIFSLISSDGRLASALAWRANMKPGKTQLDWSVPANPGTLSSEPSAIEAYKGLGSVQDDGLVSSPFKLCNGGVVGVSDKS